MSTSDLIAVLTRIAKTLETGALKQQASLVSADLPLTREELHNPSLHAMIWHNFNHGQQLLQGFTPVQEVAGVPLSMLCGIEDQAQRLLANTRQFRDGFPANNALLWGARGTGKSALIKAIHAELWQEKPGPLVLVEILREDIATLHLLLSQLRAVADRRFLVFCDDLSFESEDSAYKSLKAALEGGIEGRPSNVLFYATSNRRHLISRQMIENEQSVGIMPGEAVEEKVSLSDRFGLWLGFHNYDQAQYLSIVEKYIEAYRIECDKAVWRADALAWSMARGSRSGRVAHQYVQDLAGRLGKSLKLSATA